MATNTADVDREHPITRAVGRVESLLEELADQSTWSMAAEETRSTVGRFTRVVARMVELELRVATHAQTIRVEEESGATSTANWWAHQTKQTRAESHRKLRLAAALDASEPLRRAVAAGVVLPDQAAVIADAVSRIPTDLADATVIARAEEMLIRYAADHDAKALRILGRRILDVVAPEVGEAHEARLLEKEEREAEAAARFTMHDDGHGQSHGRFSVPTLHGEMLKQALLALAAPKHRVAADGHAPVPGRPSAEKLGQAFCEYISRYPTDRLPEAGGLAATVVVTVSLETLEGALAAAHLDTGEAISPGLARRLACEAGIIPAVLAGKSQVLDLGRETRFHTKPHRIALGIEQGGCTAEGCDWPPGLCHVHHDHPWHRGGVTNTKDARLLCPRHHARVHDPAYETTRLPANKVRFHRRT